MYVERTARFTAPLITLIPTVGTPLNVADESEPKPTHQEKETEKTKGRGREAGSVRRLRWQGRAGGMDEAERDVGLEGKLVLHRLLHARVGAELLHPRQLLLRKCWSLLADPIHHLRIVFRQLPLQLPQCLVLASRRLHLLHQPLRLLQHLTLFRRRRRHEPRDESLVGVQQARQGDPHLASRTHPAQHRIRGAWLPKRKP
mmetsp:Transcript_383/g.806  ORF Transcript_383/g.806 Transcript_383/m.806 type:complete len:201 (+) Transcript_383:181-783(+)